MTQGILTDIPFRVGLVSLSLSLSPGNIEERQPYDACMYPHEQNQRR